MQLDGEGIMDHRMGIPRAILSRDDHATANKAYEMSPLSLVTAGWRNPSS